jgi:hypothetical protein
MADQLGQAGVLQVIPPAQLEAQLQQRAQDQATAAQPPRGESQYTELAGYVKSQFEIFRNHRNTNAGWSNRMLSALRTFNGQYDPTKLIEITKYGGSTVYARITAQKCRAASSLLRDIYLGPDTPWALEAPENPDVPQQILDSIEKLAASEAQMVAQQLGQPPDPQKVNDRKTALIEEAEEAAKKKAAKQARVAGEKIEDMLRDGGFYHALAEFLVDLPIFPFAVIKGPVVKIIPKVVWPQGGAGGMPTTKQIPTLTWNRVSPFDVWFTPGVADIANANVIEKLRVTRAELNDLLDLPGYDTAAIRAVLEDYGRGGLYDNWDTTDAERSVLESRENPAWNRSGMISMMEFNGNVQGRVLQDYGLAVPDELRDYHVNVWVVGSHVIKCHLSPSPRQRHPYFVTSFEKIPGTPVGNGLTDMLSDLQEAANASLRALINNISIASGPQVVVNDDMLAPEENGEDLYPWKRWHVRNDPLGGSRQPISFFMPANNSQAMIQCYQEFVSIADDVSAIPKYVGGQAGGGAGRTASGLAMLMGNASKILQTVSANVDRDVVEESLLQLYDLLMLTDKSGMLTGLEKISVQGVSVAIQRDTQRQRQIEFLTATNNPTDQKIMGMHGRAAVLRSVSQDIGMPGEEVVPSEDAIEKMEQEHKQQAANGGNIDELIQQAVNKGVEAGVKRISTELTAGVLATHAHMPEGAPTHIGTPGSMDGGDPSVDLGHPQNQPQGQPPQGAPGNQPPAPSQSMGPQTHLVGTGQPMPGKPMGGMH